MDIHFTDVQCLLKNRQKSDLFADHFEQHFESTISRTYLRKCVAFKVLNQLNLIVAMNLFTKPNFNLCV